ncbi:MAG: hypothetical protein PHU61_01225 [Candidatus Absconditabacteria bacterium]|nr:hypothetical protein [Candidatus Absconditabacteria bacterium]MDD3868079.1 hypothetical protein [Candidatus Absconditabacteria bacterium]MDD4714326.1 hypothetical protein [Candidatus Absconditabacteria bacterium]
MKTKVYLLAMFFVAILLCAFTSSTKANANTEVVSDVERIQSFYDCWGSSLFSHTHTFECGYCTWYTINIGSSSSSSVSIRIQEIDALGDVITDNVVSIPANGSYSYTDPTPSSNLRAIRVNTASYYLEVCVATLN